MPRFMGFVRMEEGVGMPPKALFKAMDDLIGESAASGAFLDGGGLFGIEDAVSSWSARARCRRRRALRRGQGGRGRMVDDGVRQLEEAMADSKMFAELHARHWPEVAVTSTLRQVSEGPEPTDD